MSTAALAPLAPLPRSRALTAPGRGRLATWLMSVALIVWAVWVCLVLATPIHSSDVASLLEAQQRHVVSSWAVVTSDSGASTGFAPALVDPVTQRFHTTSLPIGAGTVDGEDVTSVLQTSQEPQIAWSDDRGVHVTNDFSTASWSFPRDSTVPSAAGSPSARAYRTLVTSHDVSQADTVRDLWGFGSISVGSNTHAYVFETATVASFFIGLGALLGSQPRFRTRWSWFWLFGCPLGVGLVWYLLREGWFRHEPAPAQRVSGARSFLIFVATSVVLGAGVQLVVFHGA